VNIVFLTLKGAWKLGPSRRVSSEKKAPLAGSFNQITPFLKNLCVLDFAAIANGENS
jgi:hypothetical protein